MNKEVYSIPIQNVIQETVSRYNKKLGLNLPLEFGDVRCFVYDTVIMGIVANADSYLEIRNNYFTNSHTFGIKEDKILIEIWITHEFGHHLTSNIKEKVKKIGNMKDELNECMKIGDVETFLKKVKVFREFHRQVEEEAWEKAENIIEFPSEMFRENFFLLKKISLQSYENEFDEIADNFLNSQKENV